MRKEFLLVSASLFIIALALACTTTRNPSTDSMDILSPGLVVHSFQIENYENKLFLVNRTGKQLLGSYPGGGTVNLSNNHEFAAYTWDGDIWVVDFVSNEHHNVTNSADCTEYSPVWSPDDKAIAYFGCDLKQQKDVFIYDLDTENSRNVSNTPDRIEGSFIKWWPEQPAFIFFGSEIFQEYIPGSILPPHCHSAENRCDMFLTMADIDGENYQILDQLSGTFVEPALSPDGTTIAYDGGNLYDLETGNHSVILPSDYGLTDKIPVHSDGPELIEPAWSPSGCQIAWTGHINDGGDIGVIVFDLEQNTGQVVYAFEPNYVNYALPAWYRWMETDITWSPDGKWLAFTSAEWPKAEDETVQQNFLWVASSDGEIRNSFATIAFNLEPVWSPDSKWFVYIKEGGVDEMAIELVQVESGSRQKLTSLARPKVLSWLK